MDPVELIRARRVHLARLAATHGTGGERDAVGLAQTWVPKPKGRGMKILMQALEAAGTPIKPSSFDAIHVREGLSVDFADCESVCRALGGMVFVEIKTADQDRVKDDFCGFFFALTESEIDAATKLGTRHCVALYNRRTSKMLLTSVPELLSRARSTTMQLSIQL